MSNIDKKMKSNDDDYNAMDSMIKKEKVTSNARLTLIYHFLF